VLGEDDCLIKRALDVAQQPFHHRPVILPRILHEAAHITDRECDVWLGVRYRSPPTMLR
jgi:hypothetical protein